MRLQKAVLLVTLFSVIKFFAQELPPIVKYAPNTYGAGNQNWMISQDQINTYILPIMRVYSLLMVLNGICTHLPMKQLYVQ